MNFNFYTSGYPVLVNTKKQNFWLNFGFIGIENNNAKNNCNLSDFIPKDYKVIFANQSHSSTVLNNYEEKTSSTFDAIFINKPNIVAAIKTADCIPLIFANKKNNSFVITHAGWKGALDGIIQNSISQIGNIEEIACIIGPCIRSYSYEVSDDFLKNFLSQSTQNISFFKEKQNGKFFFDLPGYVKNLILKLGIDNKKIYDCKIDTYINSKLFFSYRRSCHLTDGLEKMRNISYAYLT